MLSREKDGGVELKNLLFINQAYLAKLAWNIFHNPSTFLYKILQAKYFKYNHFLRQNLLLNPLGLGRAFF